MFLRQLRGEDFYSGPSVLGLFFVPNRCNDEAGGQRVGPSRKAQRRRAMLHVIWSIIVGFLVGLIARAILPGGNQMGFLATTLLGILGSVVGGFIGGLISKPADGAKFHPAGCLMSVIGAILLLGLWRYFR
jgi:uncharacterized membrane protein YeaQ/YmgE (transglycosylase-associated protein family)